MGLTGLVEWIRVEISPKVLFFRLRISTVPLLLLAVFLLRLGLSLLILLLAPVLGIRPRPVEVFLLVVESP